MTEMFRIKIEPMCKQEKCGEIEEKDKENKINYISHKRDVFTHFWFNLLVPCIFS